MEMLFHFFELSFIDQISSDMTFSFLSTTQTSLIPHSIKTLDFFSFHTVASASYF